MRENFHVQSVETVYSNQLSLSIASDQNSFKMDQSDENQQVKLTSLYIRDFKQLKKRSLVSWNVQPDGLFGVIGVKDFYGIIFRILAIFFAVFFILK